MRLLLVFSVSALLLAGCAAGPPSASAPSSERASAAPSGAVSSLLDQAQRARGSGDLQTASAHIERALRIDRHSPDLYVELALIRYAGGAFGQAESLAMKAASLAPGNAAVQSRAWSVVAQARESAGNAAGAAEARQRARSVGTQ